MGDRIPQEAISGIRRVQQTEDEVNRALEDLRQKKSLGTAIIFDLVGSTGYRRKYKAEAGLQKAYLHNMAVSEAITEAGGWVVKWLGDGVLGCFDQHVCGPNHTFKALTAALSALTKIEDLNNRRPLRRYSSNEPKGYIDHEIHTKIAICSGAFHYFDLSTAVDAGGSRTATPIPSSQDNSQSQPDTRLLPSPQQLPLDPMGSSVDLAARLCNLAEREVILIDAPTFWGSAPTDEDGREFGTIRGLCSLPADEIRWRELKLPEIRKSVYLPMVTAFFVRRDFVSAPQTEQPERLTATTEFKSPNDPLELSRMIQAGENPITPDECYKLVVKEKNGNDVLSLVFAQKPIPCNVAGFEKAVLVVALSRKPHVEPIKPSLHDWPDPAVTAATDKAEILFRKGDNAGARAAYDAALGIDLRNGHSLMRLAMLARDAKDSKAAMDYLMRSKESNPHCPLAWAVAGMVHLDDYVQGKTDKRDGLTRAITGFTQAKRLSAGNFHGLLEQYSTCLLAIAYFLRYHPDLFPQDDAAGRGILEELNNWPAKNSISRFAHRLALVFRDIVKGQKGQALSDLEQLEKDVEQTSKASQEIVGSVSYDHVILLRDITNLIARAGFQARVV